MFELEALPQVETGRYDRVGPQVQDRRPGNVLPALPAIASYMLFNVDSVAIVLAALTCAAKERQPNTFTLMPSAARRQAARKASAGQRKHPTERIQPPSLVAHGSLRGFGGAAGAHIGKAHWLPPQFDGTAARCEGLQNCPQIGCQPHQGHGSQLILHMGRGHRRLAAAM